MQPRYTLQGATGDQCTTAFSVYCQIFIYGCQSEPEHISGTNLAQGLEVQMTKCMAELESTISWLRIQCLNYSANGPPLIQPLQDIFYIPYPDTDKRNRFQRESDPVCADTYYRSTVSNTNRSNLSAVNM